MKKKKIVLNYAFQLGRENNSCHIFGECQADVSRTLQAFLSVTCTERAAMTHLFIGNLMTSFYQYLI